MWYARLGDLEGDYRPGTGFPQSQTMKMTLVEDGVRAAQMTRIEKRYESHHPSM